jgi:basic membrane protein A
MITDALGVHDGYYNELTYDGLKSASKEFGFELIVLEPGNETDYLSLVTQAVAEDPVLIVFSNPDLETEAVHCAEEYPEENFILMDADGDLNLDYVQDVSNLYSIEFNQNEAGFLSGILAGTYADSNILFIGADEFPCYIEYEVGFLAGIETINSALQCTVKYIDADTEENSMYEAVAALLQNGEYDIIYTLNQNDGIYLAAEEYNIPVIGYDYDYRDNLNEGSDALVCSVNKQISQAIYLSVEDYFNGLYIGQIKYYGVCESCWTLDVYDGKVINSDLTSAYDFWYQTLQNQTIIIPLDRNALEEFEPPTLTEITDSENES